jgi:hypothetical protein
VQKGDGPKADVSRATASVAADDSMATIVATGTVATGSNESGAAKLLTSPVSVINIGLQSFADDLAGQGAPVVHVQWQPPAGGDPYLAGLLAKLGR